MLARTWRKSSPCAMLVECKLVQLMWKQYGGSSKSKNRNTIWPNNSTTGYLPKENKNTNSKRYMHPYMFIAALFTTAMIWKYLNYLSIGEWIKMWYIMEFDKTMEKNEIFFAICNNMDGPRGYYTKWNMSDWERQTPYDCTHMWNLKNK